MPLVQVSCDYVLIGPTYRQALADMLTLAVSQALKLEKSRGIAVLSSDIVVQFRARDPADRNAKDIDITIFTQDYLERRVNLEARTQAIQDAVATWCDDSELNTELGRLRSYVWVILVQAAYAQFPPAQA